MDGLRAGGDRRLDRVLGVAPESLGTVDLAALRQVRDDADQEETDLSYLRRMLQGRLDVVTAELERRRGERPAAGTLVEDLPGILADRGGVRAPRGLGRHRSPEPTRVGETRREIERLVGDADLSDAPARSEAELVSAAETLRVAEVEVSRLRQLVQEFLDRAGAELVRRYRDGEVDVTTLLDEESGPVG